MKDHMDHSFSGLCAGPHMLFAQSLPDHVGHTGFVECKLQTSSALPGDFQYHLPYDGYCQHCLVQASIYFQCVYPVQHGTHQAVHAAWQC